MIDSFAKLNLLDSKSLADFHSYSKLEAKHVAVSDHNGVTYDFCSLDDMKHADEWQHEQFKYEINEHGFRFDNMPTETELAAFGCSFTFGTGLPTHMLWHNLLTEDSLNFGLPGASIKTITDVFCIASKHIKIKKAIFLLPSIPRMQIAKHHPVNDKIDYLNAMPGLDSKLCEYYNINTHEIYKYLPEEELYKIARDQIYLTELIAKIRGIDIYYSSWDPESYDFLSKMNFTHGTILPVWYTPHHLGDGNDLARDKHHPGPEHHKYWINSIKDHIK